MSIQLSQVAISWGGEVLVDPAGCLTVADVGFDPLVEQGHQLLCAVAYFGVEVHGVEGGGHQG